MKETAMYRNAETDRFGDTLALVGRLLLAMLYLSSGWGKLTGFSGTVAYIAKANVPMPEVCAAIAVFVEVVLCLMLAVGWQARRAALGMAIFTIVISPIFHGYWAVPDAQVYVQKMNFFKNMSIAGGLLAFAAFGPGRFSIDGKRTESLGSMRTA
jgi:putative oxidoreductase